MFVPAGDKGVTNWNESMPVRWSAQGQHIFFSVCISLSVLLFASTFACLPWMPFRKLTGLVDISKLSWGIGILGMPGSTAYGGFIDALIMHT